MEKIILYQVSNSEYSVSCNIKEIEVVKISNSSYWTSNMRSNRFETRYEKVLKIRKEAIEFLIKKADKKYQKAKRELQNAEHFLMAANSII